MDVTATPDERRTKRHTMREAIFEYLEVMEVPTDRTFEQFEMYVDSAVQAVETVARRMNAGYTGRLLRDEQITSIINGGA